MVPDDVDALLIPPSSFLPLVRCSAPLPFLHPLVPPDFVSRMKTAVRDSSLPSSPSLSLCPYWKLTIFVDVFT